MSYALEVEMIAKSARQDMLTRLTCSIEADAKAMAQRAQTSSSAISA